MKILDSALAEHYELGTTTLATALRLVRADGEVFAFTTHDEDSDPIDGVVYRADPGLVVNEIVITAGTNVGNLTLETLHDGTVFTPGDVLGGKWRNATFLLFRYNWRDVDQGTEPLLAGTLGELELRENTLTAELRDLRQYLQHPVGDQSSKTCRYRTGDSRCMVDLSDFTFAGSITHITNAKRIFRDSARAEAADYFGEGEITFTSGDAEGISAKVASYALDGTFTLALPLFVNLEVGDTYIAIAGDRKRFEEDCIAKFNNGLNFGGEPHRRGPDNITSTPDPAV